MWNHRRSHMSTCNDFRESLWSIGGSLVCGGFCGELFMAKSNSSSRAPPSSTRPRPSESAPPVCSSHAKRGKMCLRGWMQWFNSTSRPNNNHSVPDERKLSVHGAQPSLTKCALSTDIILGLLLLRRYFGSSSSPLSLCPWVHNHSSIFYRKQRTNLLCWVRSWNGRSENVFFFSAFILRVVTKAAWEHSDQKNLVTSFDSTGFRFLDSAFYF